MDFLSIVRGLFGLVVLVGIAFLFSNNKKKINWKLVGSGIILQFVFAILIVKGDALGKFFYPLAFPLMFFRWLSGLFVLLLNFTSEGAIFVFGNLAKSMGSEGSMGVFFAFQVLPTIIFFASLTSILYYLGVMQKIVQAMAWVMLRIMGTSGAESLSCTANIFVGQTEAPLLVKPYIKNMTNSEILTIMVGGMATIAGGVMAAYIQILGSSYAALHNIPLQEAQLMFATHLLGASFMAAPAALLVSKIIYPETDEPLTKGSVHLEVEKNSSNLVEAAAAGASDGLQLALNVAGMLIAFIALIALINYGLQGIGYYTGLNNMLIANFGQPLNLQLLLGFVFQVIAIAIGVPVDSALQFGSLFGTKIVLNEFVAYVDLGNMISLNKLLDQKAIYMATYALCGFANFSSIAIQIGGLSPMAPNRRADIAKLGFKAVLGGALATLMTATLAGILF